MSLKEDITNLTKRAKTASRRLATLTETEKNKYLFAMADAIEANADSIIAENSKDIATGNNMGLSKALLDRLLLNNERITAMADGLREVAELSDPVGRILEERKRPNGLLLTKVSSPIGVIVIIYESRPNVTADAASLCFKSGNATILRGGKEAIHSNRIIAETMVNAAKKLSTEFPSDAIQVVQTTDRAAIPELLSHINHVDLCIPRGGENLIRAVAECSRVPVIKHYKGICHVYIDGEIDQTMAEDVAFNSKVHRPGVCNAAETLLISKSIASKILPSLCKKLSDAGVELRGDTMTKSILKDSGIDIQTANDSDWDEEYLDLILSIKIVDGVEEAIEHINIHGSGHTETIITKDPQSAKRFQIEVDSSTIFWNASTRFTDGGQFGMGAEIGISTDKIGARGPMGLEELTTYKWLGVADGLIRE
ncbi:MAG: glutamate-5-semialdehyde dehydrogenase [Verrucomicrobiales bacterium]|nr:glutamate-5-semialdehyde dehydrogenase [Verrucomicrobiales bacterium]